MRQTISDEEMERRRDERAAQFAALEEARQQPKPISSDIALTDRIYAAGGYAGDSKTAGAPWSAHGMFYASSQRRKKGLRRLRMKRAQGG